MLCFESNMKVKFSGKLVYFPPMMPTFKTIGKILPQRLLLRPIMLQILPSRASGGLKPSDNEQKNLDE